MASLLSEARAAGVPVVFANDNKGVWDSDVNRLVQRALSGPGGSLLDDLLPRPGERFIVKPRYSAFDHTPLELILSELECQRLVVAGMTTEGLRRSNGHRRACTALRYLRRGRWRRTGRHPGFLGCGVWV
jgi:nicotinamidase-related amidase